MAVFFHTTDTKVTLRQRNALKMFLKKLFTREGKRLESLTYIFCSDDYLLPMNQSYLGHDTLTDIITFDLSEKGSKDITGEIYISVDRVRENAQLYKSTQNKELHRVIFHGALHLCGYKDKSPRQSQQMREKEEEYLRRYGIRK